VTISATLSFREETTSLR